MASNPFDAKHFPNCHRGHKYAEDVVRGDIPASKYLIGACERYLGEVELEDHPNFYFDPKKAERFLRLAQKFDHVIGKWKTRKIIFEPWQCWVWMNIMGFISRKTGFRRFRIAHVECARGNSKAHCLKTRVPTPDGMKLWEEIEVGSRLYDRLGGICTVTGKTPIHFPQAYEVEFSDGEKVICSDEHLWFTSTKNERSRKRRHGNRALRKTSQNNYTYESVRSTKEISRSLTAGIKIQERNHSVANTLPVKGEKKKLVVDPYVFGYWLGNGTAKSGQVSCHEADAREVRKILSERGYESHPIKLKRGSRGVSFTVMGLSQQLREMGVLGNKHIPEEYFLSTANDRLELVRGLLDSDGTINPQMRGQTAFTNKNGKLASGLSRLLCSLGYKVSRSRFKVSPENNFKSDSLFYRVCFYPRGTQRVFNIKRKATEQISKSGKHSYVGQRYIVGARKLKRKVPMFCVEVDSPDSSYLISESYIPTHNSAMASIAALYFMALDNPQGNQVATVATKKDQARIVLDSARAMARKNKSFTVSMGVRVLAHSIVQDKTNSNIRALSAEASSLDGLNDVLAVCDELHAMKRETFDVIYSGMSKRSDSLTLCITTAGFDVDSVGFTQSSYAKKVALGEFKDEQFFSAVYCLDEGDDIYDERNWIKANPNWGVSVDPITFRAKAEKTKRSPNDLPNFKVKHLDMWVSEAKAFFDQKQWDKCADPNLKIEDFLNERCRMGIDLASHIDLTSIGIIFFKNGKYYVFDRTFIPEVTMSERESENEIYADAVSKGFLIKTPGAAINNDFIRAEAIALASKFRVSECFYDTWNATEMAQKLSDKIEMVKFGMNTANLSEPMKRLDSLMREGKIVHCGSPLMRWCIGNVVAKADHNDNVYPRKTHVRLKIDPVIAVLMALAGWIQDDNKESVYETRGLRILG